MVPVDAHAIVFAEPEIHVAFLHVGVDCFLRTRLLVTKAYPHLPVVLLKYLDGICSVGIPSVPVERLYVLLH